MRRAVVAGGTLCLIVVAVGAASLGLGAGDLGDPAHGATFLALRGARLSAALLCGGALAVGGVVVQGLFRNPLASPSLLGTTAGASFGGQLALFAQAALVGVLPVAPEMALPVGCLAGALVALGVLLAFLRRGADRIAVLLIGFVLSSFFIAMGSFVVALAQEQHELGRAVVGFTLGGLGGVGFAHVWLALPLVLAGLGAAYLWARPLDLVLSGEDEAASLGLDVPMVRRWSVIWVAVLTSAAVALGGNVAFVGLVVPNALRRVVGAPHRPLVVVSAIGGAAFVALCDLGVRALPTRTEVPLGIVTGLVGAPVFLWLLARARREELDG
jgi:iron complex transport system permease protein